MRYHYNTLDDYLISQPLHIDGLLDDGGFENFCVKGRELDATILFADISSFSSRTQELTATETLIFVNHFFAWITAEAIGHSGVIVDKYIGDAIMLVFSKEFGSEDPFIDAILAARRMAEHDVFSFCPHVGIASGPVTAGFVGTPIRYNCSVFGAAVTLAARCAGVNPTGRGEGPTKDFFSASFAFPAVEWGTRDLHDVFKPAPV